MYLLRFRDKFDAKSHELNDIATSPRAVIGSIMIHDWKEKKKCNEVNYELS